MNVARNVRTIEWIKAEMVAALGDIFRALLKPQEDLMLAGLAHLVTCCYLLARRLGISYTRLDNAVERDVRRNLEQGHTVEEWFGDFSTFAEFLEARRRR
jgi:hypothetical protein